jgi:hypothetical protein
MRPSDDPAPADMVMRSMRLARTIVTKISPLSLPLTLASQIGICDSALPDSASFAGLVV